MVELDVDHRRHAVCQLAIRDLKAGAGLAHLPSGQFAANSAWLWAATLAHNLIRWIAALGLGVGDQQTVAKTLRRTLLALPGRLTRPARQPPDCFILPSGRRKPHRAAQRPAADPHSPPPAAPSSRDASARTPGPGASQEQRPQSRIG
jgi:hypothetical protein